MFFGYEVCNALTPVREVGWVYQSWGSRLGLLVATYLHLCCEGSNDWLDITGEGEPAPLYALTQVCEECLSEREEEGEGGGREGVCECKCKGEIVCVCVCVCVCVRERERERVCILLDCKRSGI